MKKTITISFFALIALSGCDISQTISASNNADETTIEEVNTSTIIETIPQEDINISLDTNTTDINETIDIQPQPVTVAQPSYQMIIDERFNSYDTSLWLKSDWANGDPFYTAWSPDRVDINNSTLTLSIEQNRSGEYRTLNSYMYGRYTTKFKASDINGTITSFFTYTGAAEGTAWDEIDVEIIGKDTTKMQVNYWRDGNEHPYVVDLGFDASLAMHQYSFIFTKEFIQWYVDDKLVHEVKENNLSDKDSLPVNAGKIIVNLWAATGIDSWSGHYEDNTSAKAIYEYITFEELSN